MTFDVYVDVIATVWSAVFFDDVSGESLPIPGLFLGSFFFPGIWVSMSASFSENGTWVPQSQVLLCVSEICCLTSLCLNLPLTLLEPPWLIPLNSQEESVSVSLFFLIMGWGPLTVGLPDGPLSLGMLSDDHEQKKTSF